MLEDFLERLRKDGWKQNEIAEFCGISPAFINGMTRGQSCSMETAIKIADAFGLPLDELVGRTPPVNHVPPEPKAKARRLVGKVASDAPQTKNQRPR